MNATKPVMQSKINWTQIIAVIAMIASMLGLDLDAEMQAALAVTIQSIASALTVIWRTWFTNTKLG